MTEDTTAYARIQITPSFLSPTTVEAEITPQGRVDQHVIYVVQPGSQPIRLQYASAEGAEGAREVLLVTSNMNDVPSMDLFQAICQALDFLVKSE